MFYNTFFIDFGPVIAAGARSKGETASPSSLYAMSCAGWTGEKGWAGRVGGVGRVGCAAVGLFGGAMQHFGSGGAI
jgi:hypothetical protein